MNRLPFSEAAAGAIADPLADIFANLPGHAATFTAATGEEFISLAAGAPDNALLPTEAYSDLSRHALQQAGALNYTMPQGLPTLRQAMEHVLQSQGVACQAENMLITSGGMEALSLSAQMLLNPGDVVITEGPGFAGALSMFRLYGAEIVQLACGETGVDPDELEAAIRLHRPKLLSLMPDFQNPTGAVMPLAHRKRIAELLQKYNVHALEDGAYAQLGFADESLPPLQSFAPEQVLYATSVSKIMAPAMRIGALIGPRAWVRKAEEIKSAYNMQASAMHQHLAAGFIGNDALLQPHLALLRETYRNRRDAMIAALKIHLPASAGFGWTQPSGGMFLWLSGPEGVDFSRSFDRIVEAGVAYVPGARFYARPEASHDRTARLNFASTPEAKLTEAVRRLGSVLLG